MSIEIRNKKCLGALSGMNVNLYPRHTGPERTFANDAMLKSERGMSQIVKTQVAM